MPTTLEKVKEVANKDAELTSVLAIDCEMVDIGVGSKDCSALARVSVVNYRGECVYDSYVKPLMKVTGTLFPPFMY